MANTEDNFQLPSGLSDLATGYYPLGKLPDPATASFGEKIRAAAALENVAGRFFWNVMRTFDDPLGDYEPRFLDASGKRLTSEFNLDQWIRDNEKNLRGTPFGATILNNYSLGYYDRMGAKQFFAAVGYDQIEASLRQDLNATTGSGLLDFGATALGSSIDPVTLLGGKALVNGVGAARRYTALKSVSKAIQEQVLYEKALTTGTQSFKQAMVNTFKDSVGMGIVQQGGLQSLDWDKRDVGESMINLAANLVADGVLGGLFNLPNIGKTSTTKQVFENLLKQESQKTAERAAKDALAGTIDYNERGRDLLRKEVVRTGLVQEIDRATDSLVDDPIAHAYEALDAMRAAIDSDQTLSAAYKKVEQSAAADFNKKVEQGSFSHSQLIDELNGDLQTTLFETQTPDSASSLMNDLNQSLDNANPDSISAEIQGNAKLKEINQALTNEQVQPVLDQLNSDLATTSVKDQSPSAKDQSPQEFGASGKQNTFFNGESDPIAKKLGKQNREPAPVFNAEEKKLLQDILDNQKKAIQTPIDDVQAMKQLENIANRNTQLFNFGRLDAMGLRQVKIDQPINAIVQQLKDQGLDLNLSNLLKQLKKLNPEEASSIIEATPELNSTYQAFKKAFQGPNKEKPMMSEADASKAAVESTLSLGEKLIDKGRTSLKGTKMAPTGGKSLEAAGDFVDAIDYFPDRANDAVRTLSVQLADWFSKIPVVGRLIDQNKPEEVRGLFNVHQRFSMRRYLFSDNPIHVGLSNTMLDPLLAMKGQTKGTIKSKFSVERLNRIIGQRTRLAQGILFNQFVQFQKETGSELFSGINAQSLLNKTSVATGQHAYLTREFTEAAERFYSDVEACRLFMKENNASDYSKAINESGVMDGRKPEYRERLTKSLESLDNLGLLHPTADSKLGKWMTADQRQIFNQTTSIRLNTIHRGGEFDGQAVTLAQLNKLMNTLFSKKGNWGIIKHGVSLASDTWSGLKPFMAIEEFDEATGQFVKKHGVVTMDEVLSSVGDAAKETAIVRRIVEEFNDKWGLIPISRIENLKSQLELSPTNMSGKSMFSFSAMNTLEKTSRFLQRFEMAEQLTDRLRELEALRIRRTYSPEQIQLIREGKLDAETILSSKIRQFDQMKHRLSTAMDSATPDAPEVLDAQTPELFHFWTQYSQDAIDAITNEAKDYFVNGKLWAEGTTPEARAKAVHQNNIESDALGQHMKEIFGLTPRPPIDPIGTAIINTTQSMVLGKAGVTQLLDYFKSLFSANMYGDTGVVSKSFSQFSYLLSSARKSGLSNEDLGYVLESMQTHLEDVQSMVSRRLEDASGNQFFDSGRSDSGLVNATHAHRWLIGKASGMEFVNDAAKMASYSTANSLLGGKNGLISRSRQIVDLMRSENLSPLEAAQRLASQNAFDLNSFHAFNKIAANLNHDEIVALDDILKTLSVRKVETAGRFGLPGVSIESFDIPANVADKELAQHALRKYGNLVDYWIEREMLNVPTASSNLLITQPHGFINRAMTLFLRTTIAALDNHGVGQSNVSLFTRIPMLAYMTGLSFGVLYLKAALSGPDALERFHDRMDDPAGLAGLAAQSLDYSGYLGILSSKSLNFALDMASPNYYDRANSGEYQLMSPVQSFALQLGRATGGLVQGRYNDRDVSLSQSRMIRKIFGLNLFDSTFGGLLDKGLHNKFTEHTPLETLGDFIYPENAE